MWLPTVRPYKWSGNFVSLGSWSFRKIVVITTITNTTVKITMYHQSFWNHHHAESSSAINVTIMIIIITMHHVHALLQCHHHHVPSQSFLVCARPLCKIIWGYHIQHQDFYVSPPTLFTINYHYLQSIRRMIQVIREINQAVVLIISSNSHIRLGLIE